MGPRGLHPRRWWYAGRALVAVYGWIMDGNDHLGENMTKKNVTFIENKTLGHPSGGGVSESL